VVAVKSVDASKFRSISEIEQIQEEMNVLSSLTHPNIIRLIEIHFINSVFFLVMVGD
jgi:serine/threonine protein kinase